MVASYEKQHLRSSIHFKGSRSSHKVQSLHPASRAANPKLVANLYCLASLQMYFHHFFTTYIVIEFILQCEQHLPGFYIYYFTTRWVCISPVKAEGDPSRHILQWNGCQLLVGFPCTENMQPHVVPIGQPELIFSGC